MLELKSKQTSKFLKSKIIEILQKYSLELKNLFSVTCDNGANMCAAVKELQRHFELEKLEENEADTDNEEWSVLDSIVNEMKDSVNLIRCAVHTLQLAVTDMVKKYEDAIRAVTTVAKNCKKVAYKIYYENENQAIPPLYSRTRWGGIFKMLNHFESSEDFYIALGAKHKELDLTDSWAFIHMFVEVFRPVYDCTIKMQDNHIGLSDFYLEWLNTTRRVSLIKNYMASQLCESLGERLNNLKQSMPFKAAVLLDPRFHYQNSTVFTPDEREDIRKFIINTSARISALKEETPSLQHSTVTEPAVQQDELDSFLTDMFGGSLAGSSGDPKCIPNKTLPEQLSVLDAGLRQPHHVNVWEYWVQKKIVQKDLFEAAAVIYAVPSTQVSVERAFSALALTLSDQRTSLGENTLEDLLTVKLNQPVLDKITFELK